MRSFWNNTFLQEEELNNNRGEDRVRTHGQKPSRTGWPQHVWALELKQWNQLVSYKTGWAQTVKPKLLKLSLKQWLSEISQPGLV